MTSLQFLELALLVVFSGLGFWIFGTRRGAADALRVLDRICPDETTPAADTAPSEDDDDWADIAAQVEAENVNAPVVTETKPMRVGESREALAAYLGIPNNKSEGN